MFTLKARIAITDLPLISHLLPKTLLFAFKYFIVFCDIFYPIPSSGLTSRDTLYLEVLGIAGQQEEWESFTKDIADKWMNMKLNGKAPVPHWAKQWSYLSGIDRHIQEVTKSVFHLQKISENFY